MQDILADFFMNDSAVDQSVMDFLKENPVYCRSMQRLLTLDKLLTSRLGEQEMSLFLEYEAAANAVHSMSCTGYYLFGLKLRREVREALWWEAL